MNHLSAVGPGLFLVLVFWALWYAFDPALRSESVSWTRLVVWFLSPLALYIFLTQHKEPPSTAVSPLGQEGRITQLEPLQVEVFGSFWHARCPTATGLRLGDRVRVSKRDGLTLLVERLP
ncbi:MAG: NfeD family protein [Vicinamibacteria bacterium]